ncbi:uncharacterized protein [Pithys albifrons albifrons]|uniref:uncharacterized protein n=1 Tax=Pithys albifrons albifrons TaxID=3385563 RepID=UPI003A5CCC72
MRGVQRPVATAHARSTARRPYCARAEYRAVSLLRMRGSGVAIAHARSTARRPSCARPESASLSLLLDATSRVRSWRCFPAPAAAGAAGARGEHPAAGAAAAEAFLERGAGTIARSAAAKIPGVLGGFLKLIALKASDPQGFDLLNSIMEHMPPMFETGLEKMMIPEIQKVSGQVEKQIRAVGITKTLTECPPVMDTEYPKLWIPLLQALPPWPLRAA